MDTKTTSPSSTAQTILIVEDNEDLRENAVLVLTLEGYNVFSATDGQEALDMLMAGECSPDLIVSDIAMPRLDGYGFFEAVHSNPLLRTIPFIFLTARGSRRDVRFGKELGVDDYLIKPFNADDFLVTVKSKLKRNQEIRQQAETRLDDARRAMVQLLSHELRTPLTYVTGGFSLLADGLEQDKLPSDMQLSMGLIKSGTERLNHLAEQLVMYAELISGHSKIQLDKLGEAQDLEALVKQAMTKVQREATARSIRFDVESRLPHPLKIFTVADLIVHALYEVTRNAVAYSGEGGNAQINLSLGDNAGNAMVVISITDHGRGIAQQDQERIWEIMIQSERTKHEQQGAGMGLPIVKQIMLLHGGTASLHSEPHVGTTVTLSLPVYQAQD